MLKNQKKKKEFEENYELSYASDDFFKKPIVKIVVRAGIVFGALYISRYFINTAAETVRACKNFRNAVKE